MPRPGPSRPLVVSQDARLLDHLVRLSAQVAVDLQVSADVSAAGWSAAPLVVAGADRAEALAARGLPARDGVLVVTVDGADPAVWHAAAALGADAVLVLPLAEALLADRLTTGRSSVAAPVVAVVPGCGGAGASTLATALAVTAARQGERPMLVDADPWGGGLDLLLGAEASVGLRWPALADARGGLGADELRSALPQVDGITVLSWDRGPQVDLTAGAAEAVVAAGRRAHDVVLVDVPGRPGPVGTALLREADLVLLVVAAEVRAVAAAARVSARLGPGDVRVVVRTGRAGRSTRASRLPATDLARSLGRPLAGELPSEPGVRTAAEQGEPPARTGRGPLARLCRSLLVDLLPVGRAA